MTRARFVCSVAVLVAANGILSFFLWRLLTADPILRGLTLSSPEVPVTVISAPSTFNRVVRRGDPIAARLFGLPPAEVPTPARPVEGIPSKEPALRLVGIIMTEGTEGEQTALVEYGIPAHIARLRTGAHLYPSGWRIERISSSSVEMIRGDERQTLKLD